MRKPLVFLFSMFILAGCGTAEPVLTPAHVIASETPLSPVVSAISSKLSAYAFPASIDPSKRYLFYLHGRIIEDRGIPAISPDYGEYEYVAILDRLAGYGFVVISEQRPKITDVAEYAKKIAGQVTALLEIGVPARSITVIGASKGAYIVMVLSNLLKNEEMNFIIMGTCHPDTIEDLGRNKMFLYGNVLSIYDSVDEFSGSCRELFALSETGGLARHDEIVLHTGLGHGILYKPLDEWVVPAVEWAGGN